MSQAPVRQLSLRAVVLGIVLSVVLAGANAYLGLFAGMTVSASIPAAVISMAVLRGLSRGTVLENNIVQTAASAGEALAAGVIFTFPALVLMHYWTSFDYGWVTIIAGLGGLLGVLFTIPLRRPLIVDQALTFPEGVATAEVLRIGERAGRGARYLGGAALAGGGMKLCETGLRLWPSVASRATFAGRGVFYVGANLSPALLGVGYIVGLNIAVLVFAGGAVAWFVAIPLYAATHTGGDAGLGVLLASGAAPAKVAEHIWSTRVRYMGVGAMLVGGIWALVSMGPSLWHGLRAGLAAGASNRWPESERDLPMRWVLGGVVVCVVPIYLVYAGVAGSHGVGLALTAIMVVAGFLFSAVAAYMAGVVGSSNNPVSGVTIATILMTALLLYWMLGPGAATGAASAIMVGAVICCAAAIGGDNLQDLKAGNVVGATPWKQQIAQTVGVLSAALVMAPVLDLLLDAYGFGAPSAAHPHPLPAPQATLMAAVARGVFGGSLPWRMVTIGGALGIVIIALDRFLERTGSRWRAPVLAVAVGIYLPLDLSTPILAGGLIAEVAARRGGSGRQNGVLLAAGLITGEALLGILLAVPIVASGRRDVLALAPQPLLAAPAGLVLLALIGLALYRVAAARSG
ncbi:MAG TPA: oligopeptide transporter, OPT family [Gammaproteobacteria bacterium]|nr:oligopeptide transporter, OPT family [Gammaproteobacteria bacterium]